MRQRWVGQADLRTMESASMHRRGYARTWGRNHAGVEAWSAREWGLPGVFVRTGAGKGDGGEF